MGCNEMSDAFYFASWQNWGRFVALIAYTEAEYAEAYDAYLMSGEL